MVSSSESSHDFGTVTEGDNPKHTFVLTNAGPNTIVLDRVQPASSYVKAELRSPQIPSGKKAELDVTLQTLGHPGDQDKLITVGSSDPSVAPTKLRVHAKVEPLLAIQEEEEDEESEDMLLGASATREVWITGKKVDEAHFAIDKVTNPDVSAEMFTKPEGDAVRHGIRLIVRGKALGHFHCGVHVRTGIDAKPMLKHYFEWSVEGNLKVSPISLHFETGGAAAPEERVVELKSRLDGFEVKAAKCDSAVFKVTVHRSASPKTWEVRVRVADPQALAKIQVARIEITTNDPAQPMVVEQITVAPKRN